VGSCTAPSLTECERAPTLEPSCGGGADMSLDPEGESTEAVDPDLALDPEASTGADENLGDASKSVDAPGINIAAT
jgi:hypothetical protein